MVVIHLIQCREEINDIHFLPLNVRRNEEGSEFGKGAKQRADKSLPFQMFIYFLVLNS